MDEEFLATAYPKVHENLKLITDERVIDDKPESHSGSMSSMKNLDDTFNFGDQFLHDKPTEDEQEKSKIQFLTAVDYYLGTKLDDALLKVLERHTADLIEKYSVLPGPEFVKNQESEKSPKEIIRAKKEQDEEKQDSTYSISHMNKKKSANKNTTNYRLYHALMEALIADEDAMDKEVADKVKDHKRKHDSDDDEDDDDDEGPSAGSNQGSAGVVSSMHNRSQSEHSEQSSDDIPMQDEGNDSDMEDTDNAHIPKVSTTTWFKPIPKSERPATPEPEWTIPPNDFQNQNITGQMPYATHVKVFAGKQASKEDV
ncbi:hypothetical protein Tco_1391937 [Tanacetum coccineum]